MKSLSFVHFDADAFFASVEQAADRRLRGRAMAVGGQRRGIIASASYEARARGIFTPMSTAEALRRCPELVVVPGHYDLYEQFSENIFALCRDLTPLVEKVSIDEGYLDLRPTRWRDPTGAIRQIRALDAAITGWMKITVSHGLATNKLVSAIASKLRKPHGMVVVPAGTEAAFLAPLPVSCLPGLGPRLVGRLAECGIQRLADLTALPATSLRPLLGGQVERFRQMARGEDERPLCLNPPPAQSYGRQHTFASDQANEVALLAEARAMLDTLFVTIRGEGRRVRTLSLRIRYADREECERRESLDEPSDVETDFYPLLKPLLQRCWQRRVRLRLLGLRLSNVYEGVFQPDFFAPEKERRRTLAQVMDRLNREHGKAAICRASRLVQPTRLEEVTGERKDASP